MRHMKPVPERRPKANIIIIVVACVCVLAVGALLFSTLMRPGGGGSSNQAATASQGKTGTTSQGNSSGKESPAATTQPSTSATTPAPASAPEPAPSPTPAPQAAASVDTSQLSNTCAEIAAGSGMDTSIAVTDLTNGANAEYDGDRSVVSASMIKLIVAEAFLEQVQAGTYDLDASYVLQPQDIVGGTGTLSGLGAGASVTYREILERMINVSDNTGANILINAVGMDTVNAAAQRLGLTGTQLNRLMMDTDAISAGIENYVSANDVARLLSMVYNGTFVDQSSSSLMLNALEQQEDGEGIAQGLPGDAVFAHKTGTLSNARHDGGIVECSHPYVIVVLCSGDGFSAGGATQTMINAASTIHSIMVGA